jgi:hypothetical protein
LARRPSAPLLASMAAVVVATSMFTIAASPVAGASTAGLAAIGQPRVPANGLLFGASVSAASGQNAAQAFAAEEAQLGRGLALDRSYARWDDAQPTSQVLDDAAHGRVPVLSIVPRRKDGSTLSWASIADGSHDAEVRAQADSLRDSAVPMILVFHHEADIAPGFGTATDFVAAFRHYVSVFRAENATNIAYAVVLVPPTFANPAAWYPGDDVVDWIGTDAYNFAACAPGLPSWRSLAQVADSFHRWGAARGKPLLLAEWGAAEDLTQPGRKAAWLQDAATTLAGWPEVKAAAYFDRLGSCNWPFDTSGSSLSAFQGVAQSPLANGRPTARLLQSVAIGPAPLYETFGSRTSTGSGSATGSGVTSWSVDFGDGSPILTGTGQPGLVPHKYLAGHWTATLTVTDATGATATTTAKEISAPAPVVSTGNPTGLTSTTATLPAWVATGALSASYHFEWGTTTSLGSSSAVAALPALDYTQAVTRPLTGLQPSTRYYWRIVASSAAGTTASPTRWLDTPLS